MLSWQAGASPVDQIIAEIQREAARIGKTDIRKVTVDIGPITSKGEGRDLNEVCDMPTGWVLDGSPSWHETYRTGDSSWNGITLLSEGSTLKTAQSYYQKLVSEAGLTATTAEGTQVNGRLQDGMTNIRQTMEHFQTGSQAIRYRARVAPSYREYSIAGMHYSDLKGRGCLRGEIHIPIRYVGMREDWEHLLSCVSGKRAWIK